MSGAVELISRVDAVLGAQLDNERARWVRIDPDLETVFDEKRRAMGRQLGAAGLVHAPLSRATLPPIT